MFDPPRPVHTGLSAAIPDPGKGRVQHWGMAPQEGAALVLWGNGTLGREAKTCFSWKWCVSRAKESIWMGCGVG